VPGPRRLTEQSWLGVLLAVIAGYVDAVGFTHLFDVFPANQSGNAVLLGVAIGDPSWRHGWRPGLSITAFALGVALGIVIGSRLRESRRTPALLALQSLLLVAFAALAGNVKGEVAPIGGTKEAFLLVVSSTAMGIETDVVRRIAGVSVFTTFQTGTITRIADVGTAEVEHLMGIEGAPAPPPDARKMLVVLGAVIGGYILGSAFGTAVVTGWGGALWIPAIMSVGLVVWAARRPLTPPPLGSPA
jgi:uncharacterized membrane protein YoaK (UPF0700 family)